jgi:uncharacterized protein (TIGR02452 family)
MEGKDMRRRDKFSSSQKHYKHTGKPDPKLKHKQSNNLVDVWKDTEKYSFKYYNKANGYKYIHDDLNVSDNLDNLSDASTCDQSDNIKNKPIISIENIDTLDMAIRCVADGYNVLVLNMASEYKPGGGVRNGKTAQEEVLFRRSNACVAHPMKLYPINTDEIIYAPDITIFKNSEYEYIDGVEISMVSCPAIRRPHLNKTKYIPNDYNIMSNKIEAIFKLGVINMHDCLVLGALGCGVFRNPPREVAKIFKKNIKKYGHYFRNISFAILTKNDSSEENIEIFKEILYGTNL